MTTEDHNKLVGILNLIYGGFSALALVVMFFFFGFMGSMLSRLPSRGGDEFPLGIFILVMGLIMAFTALFSIPPLVAGYGLLKRRSWAKTAGIVSAVFAALNFPFGTALCAYSLWFLLGEGGRLYDQRGTAYTPPQQLHNASPYSWDARPSSEREKAYTPPPQPPDWRG